jgi:predicted MFS family arabinose efflux permease
LSRAVARFADRTVLSVSLAALAAVFLGAFTIHHTAWNLVLFSLIGPPAVCFLVTVDTRLAVDTPDSLLGRTSAAYNTTQSAATLAGLILGGYLGQALGIVAAADVACLVIASSAAIAMYVSKPVPERGPAPVPALGGSGLSVPRDPSAPLAVSRAQLDLVLLALGADRAASA